MNNEKIQLVCRLGNHEIARQQFEPSDAARADRIMIARNRAEVAAQSDARWAIETETKVRRIVVVLETRSARNYGFRYTDTQTGITVEAQITGGESNILHALTHDGRGWLSDYYRETVTVPEKHLFALPCAGCTPDEIRKWVAETSAALLSARVATNAPTA